MPMSFAGFKLLIRAIGVLVLGLGLPELITGVLWAVQVLWPDSGTGNVYPGFGIWQVGMYLVGPIAKTGIGFYLLFGADRLILHCVSQVKHGCFYCGYDLRGTTGERCTECGEPFHPNSGVLGQPSKTHTPKTPQDIS